VTVGVPLNTGPASIPARTRRITLAFLVGIYSLSMVDRQILAILVEPIKADLGLTDTQVGLTSDALEPRFGTGALRYALMITLVADLWSAAHFLRAGRTLRSELGSTA
jgi:hypothetical protein